MGGFRRKVHMDGKRGVTGRGEGTPSAVRSYQVFEIPYVVVLYCCCFAIACVPRVMRSAIQIFFSSSLEEKPAVFWNVCFVAVVNICNKCGGPRSW